MAIKTRRQKPKLEGWAKVRAERNKFDAARWAYELRNAGDYSDYDFSLGHNSAVSFIDDLKHTGDFAGKPFELELWQEAMLRLIFDEEGLPRYRYVLIGLPRKNGKTELVAAIVIYLMFGTGLGHQNIYSASGDAEQAGLIHRAAASMINQSEPLFDRANVYKGNVKRIVWETAHSEYKALSSEAYSKFGLRPSVNVFDEVHVFPNEDLHTALETAFGATKRPFTIYITTAGYDQTSLCFRLWKRAREAMADPKSDPKFLGILYEFREGDDWQDEAVWHRINPGLGKFRGLENLRDDMADALRSPLKENSHRQYYLNEWTNQAVRWISERSWAACGLKNHPWEAEELIGLSCYAGFDYGVTGDMACLWLVFPMADGTIKTAGRAWVPKNGKWRNESRNRDRYIEWHREGLLRFTDKHDSLNTAIDEDQVEKEIVELNEKFPFFLLCGDRAYCNRLLTRLLNDHMIPTNGIPQGSVTLNEACVTLEKMVLNEEIHHGDSPILNWNIQNASVKRNSTGLIHPDKTIATERIDGLAALVNALAAYSGDKEQRWSSSIYEKSGSLAL